MDTRGIIELVFVGLIVLNLAALSFGILAVLKAVSAAVDRLQASVDGLQAEVVPTLQSARSALERAQNLAESADSLVRAEVAPTLQVTRAALGNVERTTHAVSETVEGIGRIATVVNAVTEPASLGSALGKAFQSPKSRLALLVLGTRVGLGALLSSRAKRESQKARRNSNGPAGQ